MLQGLVAKQVIADVIVSVIFDYVMYPSTAITCFAMSPRKVIFSV